MSSESGDENKENWYVLEVRDVDETISALSYAGVPCNDLSKLYESAVAFPSSSIDAVVNCLRKQSHTITLEPTNIENMLFVKFSEDSDMFERPAKHFEGWDSLVPVMKSVYETFDLKIVPTNPHGSSKKPVDAGSNDDYLYVHFWSAPESTKKRTLHRAFGISLDLHQQDAVEPSKIGVPIIDDDGVTVAEYLNTNLYILFDLPHAEGDNVTEVFARIMRAYFALRGKFVNELIDFYRNIRKPVGISSRDEFIRSCSKLYEKNLEMMEKSLKAYDNTIDDYNQKLVESKREREILLMKLEPLQLSLNSRKDWASKEYEALCASPHVKDVMVVGKTIHIFTDMITIHYGSKDYNIGEFKIDIYTDGGNSGVKAFNLTRTIGNALYHPHVKKSGECCLGNISNGVSKLLAEYQYVVLAQLMITYLQSYNADNAYARLELWK